MVKRLNSEKESDLYKTLPLILASMRLAGKEDTKAWKIANYLKRRECWNLSMSSVVRELHWWYKAADMKFTIKKLTEEYYKVLPFLIKAEEKRLEKGREENGWTNTWRLTRIESRRYRLWKHYNKVVVIPKWIFYNTQLKNHFFNNVTDGRIYPLSNKQYMAFARNLIKKLAEEIKDESIEKS